MVDFTMSRGRIKKQIKIVLTTNKDSLAAVRWQLAWSQSVEDPYGELSPFRESRRGSSKTNYYPLEWRLLDSGQL